MAREGGDGTLQESEALEGKNETEACYKVPCKGRRQVRVEEGEGGVGSDHFVDNCCDRRLSTFVKIP